MLSAVTARNLVAERGPRFAVTGTIRKDEMRLHLVASAAQAELLADSMRRDHIRGVKIHLPIGEPDLGKVGRELGDARRQLAEQMLVAEAAALRAIEAGMSESEVARSLAVDRMTVRKWLGKR